VDEGEPLPDRPHRWIEENLWRAIRYGLPGELIDLSSYEVLPARAALERLIEWVLPVAEELGTTAYLAVPTAHAAARQIARYEVIRDLNQTVASLQLSDAQAVSAGS